MRFLSLAVEEEKLNVFHFVVMCRLPDVWSVEHLHLLSPTLTRFDGGRVQSRPGFYAPAVILARGHQIKMEIKI